MLTQQKLDAALSEPRPPGQRLGAYLVQQGLVSETQLTQILGQQLSVPWVSLYHIDFSRQLLNLVPRDVAEKYCLVPIYVRRVRKQGETLYVAMDDPTNEGALAEVTQHAGLPTQPMIAAPSDIRSAIRVYYGEGETTAAPPPVSSADLAPIARSRSSIPPAAPEAAKPPRPPPPPPPAKKASASGDSPDAEPEIEAKEVEIPRRAPRSMVAVTMLDGTKLHMPSSRGEGDEEPHHAPKGEMTARDLVRALRAVAHGKDPAELPHDMPKWEELYAALLSILMRKGLVADWEFIDELKKVRRRKIEAKPEGAGEGASAGAPGDVKREG